MMKKTIAFALLLATAAVLPACGRLDSPSMLNTSRPQLVPETTLVQMPVDKITDGYLYNVADTYERYGVETMQISLAYDPASKSYTAMKAFEDLSSIKKKLKTLGVRSITGETVKSEGAVPTLMISYDSVTAQPPVGCNMMPGYDNTVTNPHIGDYKFGCSVDTMLAKQIYRPADLQGVGSGDAIDGRRATNVVEYYRNVSEEDATGDLNRLGRTEIQE